MSDAHSTTPATVDSSTIDRGPAAWEAAIGRPMLDVEPEPTDRLHEAPEPDEDARYMAAEEMQELLDKAIKAAEGDSNDDEFEALRFALGHALTRWPEVDSTEF